MTSFYIVLPSNTNVEANKTNSFRVRLPHKLQFNSEWEVGLAVMVYPHTWPSLGTTSEQYLNVTWQTDEVVRLNVPSSSCINPHQLKDSLDRSLNESCVELSEKMVGFHLEYLGMLKELRAEAKQEYNILKEMKKKESLENVTKAEHTIRDHHENVNIKTEAEIYSELIEKKTASLNEIKKKILSLTNESGFEAWINAYRKPSSVCNFEFFAKKNRFSLYFNRKFVKNVAMTEQLAYILGFDSCDINEPTVAKFIPDMRGGVSCFHVYAPGLIEPMVIGDVSSPVLRIVNIRGQQDEIIEEQFLFIQYHKLLVKEISEIFVEIRTSSGALMPFQYGTCTLTLHFKKSPYF